jgi:hypothetical protein
MGSAIKVFGIKFRLPANRVSKAELFTNTTGYSQVIGWLLAGFFGY